MMSLLSPNPIHKSKMRFHVNMVLIPDPLHDTEKSVAMPKEQSQQLPYC